MFSFVTKRAGILIQWSLSIVNTSGSQKDVRHRGIRFKEAKFNIKESIGSTRWCPLNRGYKACPLQRGSTAITLCSNSVAETANFEEVNKLLVDLGVTVYYISDRNKICRMTITFGEPIVSGREKFH